MPTFLRTEKDPLKHGRAAHGCAEIEFDGKKIKFVTGGTDGKPNTFATKSVEINVDNAGWNDGNIIYCYRFP